MSTARLLPALALSALLLAGCGGAVDLYAGLSEKDANDITAELDRHGMDAEKVASGKQLFAVRVPQDRFAASVAVLQAAGLPRNAFSRMGDVFKKDGMISTPTEERARFLAALSQELENTLSQIDGVVLARVHPVLPERVVPGEPVLPSSCSILVKHVRGWNAAAYEPMIRKLVLAGIPGLAGSPDKVAVIFVQVENVMQDAPRLPPPAPGGKNTLSWLGGALAVLLGIGGPAGWWMWQRRRSQETDDRRLGDAEPDAELDPDLDNDDDPLGLEAAEVHADGSPR